MIRALYNLGRIYEKKFGSGYEYENPNPKGYYNNILKIIFDINEDVIYKGVELEEFSTDKLNLYLYSKGTSRGGDNTPISIVSKPEDPLDKLIKPIKKMDDDNFKKLQNYFDEKYNYDEVNNELIEIMSKDSKEGYITTIIINGKWIGEINSIKEKIVNTNNESYYHKSSIGTSLAKNKICYCCQEEKESIYGYVNTYNFYTVDKQGFVSGGFNQNNAWKNYPVCSECADILDKGKNYLESKFLDKFSGMTYMIIPKSIFNLTTMDELDGFEELLDELEEKNKISLGKEKKDELFYQEEISFDVMSELSNNIHYNIMFYEKSNNAFKILINIEDVLPSRLRKLFDTKEKIEEKGVYKHLKSKDEFKDLKFTFGTLREFFGSNDNKHFLDIINSVFIDKPISYSFLLTSFLKTIYNNFNEEKGNYYTSRNSLLALEVLNKLNLLKGKKKGVVKEMIEKTEKNSLYLDFIESHQETFDTDLKRAVFFEGVLVQNLLNLPEQKSKAFYARLNSLKMNEKILKRVYVEAINKLSEYKKKHFYNEIEKLISIYLTSSDFKAMSNDEMSYYFVLGMNLAGNFKVKNEDEALKEE